MTWQEYALLLVAFAVLVAGITAVGLKKMKITVEVAVGSGVLVARVGVIVTVGVRVGTAAAVLVRAAFAVCTIRVPIVLGSIVGITGAAPPGIHAMTVTSAMNQSRYFVLGVVIFLIQIQINLRGRANASYLTREITAFPR
jgi:hypothetical protein